jgi:hypothetical protein
MTKLHKEMIRDKGYEYIKTGSEHFGNQPSYDEINAWFEDTFGHKPRDDTYIQEWYGRFSSPRRVWSMADYNSRKNLKKHFPQKFGKLSIKTNLNNPEHETKDKWNYWDYR